jgi:hypothetical protein
VRTRYFVLSSVAVAHQNRRLLEEEIAAFKRELFTWRKPADWEIKGRDLKRGENAFAELRWKDRLEIIKRLTCSGRPGCPLP